MAKQSRLAKKDVIETQCSTFWHTVFFFVCVSISMIYLEIAEKQKANITHEAILQNSQFNIRLKNKDKAV